MSASRSLVAAARSSSEAWRVARTVDKMPPPAAATSAYVAPASRLPSSARLSPANTTCVCASTKPGTTRSSSTVDDARGRGGTSARGKVIAIRAGEEDALAVGRDGAVLNELWDRAGCPGGAAGAGDRGWRM